VVVFHHGLRFFPGIARFWSDFGLTQNGCLDSLDSEVMNNYPLVLEMAIEIVDLPIKNCGSVHSYVAVYQRVYPHYSISSFLYPT
jgi:hypothetical protein